MNWVLDYTHTYSQGRGCEYEDHVYYEGNLSSSVLLTNKLDEHIQVKLTRSNTTPCETIGYDYSLGYGHRDKTSLVIILPSASNSNSLTTPTHRNDEYKRKMQIRIKKNSLIYNYLNSSINKNSTETDYFQGFRNLVPVNYQLKVHLQNGPNNVYIIQIFLISFPLLPCFLLSAHNFSEYCFSWVWVCQRKKNYITNYKSHLYIPVSIYMQHLGKANLQRQKVVYCLHRTVVMLVSFYQFNSLNCTLTMDEILSQ